MSKTTNHSKSLPVSLKNPMRLAVIAFLLALLALLTYDLHHLANSLLSIMLNVIQSLGISILIFFAASLIKIRNARQYNDVNSLVHTTNYVAIYLLLSVFIAGFYAVLMHEWLVVFNCVLTFTLIFLVLYLERRYSLILPHSFKFILLVFLYLSLYLGEVRSYFHKIQWWDIALHFSSAIFMGLIGFVIIYIIFRRHNIRSSYFVMIIFTFTFSMTVGALWEILEFCTDLILGTNMQKSGLVDTMLDLITNAAGALLVSLSCYLYVKYNRRGLMTDIIKEFVNSNPSLMKQD